MTLGCLPPILVGIQYDIYIYICNYFLQFERMLNLYGKLFFPGLIEIRDDMHGII